MRKVGESETAYYVPALIRYSTIHRDELLQHAAADSGLTVSQIDMALLGFEHEIEQMLLNGHGLALGDIGTIRLAINAKAQQQAEDVSADDVERVKIILTPSTKFKLALADTTLELAKTNTHQPTKPDYVRTRPKKRVGYRH